MKVFAMIGGIVLMIGAFAYMITLLATAPAPDSTGFLTAVLCSNDEIMTRTVGERFENGFFKVDRVPHHLFCQNSAGVMREVSGQAFAVVMVGYLTLFLTGLFSFLFGSLSLARERLLAQGMIAKTKRKEKLLI